MSKIIKFVDEINRIEGITRPALGSEVIEMDRFLNLSEITVGELTTFVSVFEPTAIMRVQSGCDVRVGNHLPPSGGIGIMYGLENILDNINESTKTPWENHVDYETLHPFTDCNGRSGRALWAWQMLNEGQEWWLDIGFLHMFYYQSLEHARLLGK